MSTPSIEQPPVIEFPPLTKSARPPRVEGPPLVILDRDDHWDDYAKLPNPSAGGGMILVCVIVIILGVLKYTGVI